MKIVAETYIYPSGCPGSASELVSLFETSKYDGDPDYVHGAIDLRIGNVVLFDKTMWDLVDQLWIYIIIAMEQASFSSGAEFYFPDQPVLVTIDSSQSYWKFFVKYRDAMRSDDLSRSVKIHGDELLSRLMPLAVKSLKAFQVLIPSKSNDYGKYIAVAQRIGISSP
jgi:hypothetical protein